MVYCSKCGKKNQDDSEFCIKCGKLLNKQELEIPVKQQAEEDADKVKETIRKAGKTIEQAAKDVGDVAEKLDRHIERKFDQTKKGFEYWYDKTFHIVGPLIWSFLGIIILRVIIWGMASIPSNISVIVAMSDFLYDYLLLFFGLMLIASYNSYFYRKYKQYYRWISPMFSTIVGVVLLWIAAKLFSIIDAELDIPVLATVSSFIETYIIILFVVIVVLSYGFMLVFVPFIKEIK